MRIAFTDLETTGLRPDWHEIIEIGAVIFDDRTFEIFETIDVKVRPFYPQRIDPKAQAVNGYSEKDWASGVGHFDALERYVLATKGCVFAAQNVTFDWSFIEAALRPQKALQPAFDKYKIDLMSMAYAKIPHAKVQSWSLKTICSYLGVPPEPKVHRALNGAMAGYECYKRLLTM